MPDIFDAIAPDAAPAAAPSPRRFTPAVPSMAKRTVRTRSGVSPMLADATMISDTAAPPSPMIPAGAADAIARTPGLDAGGRRAVIEWHQAAEATAAAAAMPPAAQPIPDIFDQIAPDPTTPATTPATTTPAPRPTNPAQGAGDIFDQVAANPPTSTATPAGDIFDQISPDRPAAPQPSPAIPSLPGGNAIAVNTPAAPEPGPPLNFRDTPQWQHAVYGDGPTLEQTRQQRIEQDTSAAPYDEAGGRPAPAPPDYAADMRRAIALGGQQGDVQDRLRQAQRDFDAAHAKRESLRAQADASREWIKRNDPNGSGLGKIYGDTDNVEAFNQADRERTAAFQRTQDATGYRGLDTLGFSPEAEAEAAKAGYGTLRAYQLQKARASGVDLVPVPKGAIASRPELDGIWAALQDPKNPDHARVFDLGKDKPVLVDRDLIPDGALEKFGQNIGGNELGNILAQIDNKVTEGSKQTVQGLRGAGAAALGEFTDVNGPSRKAEMAAKGELNWSQEFKQTAGDIGQDIRQRGGEMAEFEKQYPVQSYLGRQAVAAGASLPVVLSAILGPLAFGAAAAGQSYAGSAMRNEDQKTAAGRAILSGVLNTLLMKLVPIFGHEEAGAMAGKAVGNLAHGASVMYTQNVMQQAIDKAGSDEKVDFVEPILTSLIQSGFFNVPGLAGAIHQGAGKAADAMRPSGIADARTAEPALTRPGSMQTPAADAEQSYSPGPRREFPAVNVDATPRGRDALQMQPGEAARAGSVELPALPSNVAPTPAGVRGAQGTVERTPRPVSTPAGDAAAEQVDRLTRPQPVRTYDELRRMPGDQLRQQAAAWGVTSDARGTTIPRILDAQERWRLGQMSDKELWDNTRAQGLRAGSRQQNIDALVSARRQLPVNVQDAQQPTARTQAAPTTPSPSEVTSTPGGPAQTPAEGLEATPAPGTAATAGVTGSESQSPLAHLGGKRRTFQSGDRTFTVDYIPDTGDPRTAFITGLSSKGTGGKFADVAQSLAEQLKAEGFRDVTYRPDGEDGRDAARRRLFEAVRQQVKSLAADENAAPNGGSSRGRASSPSQRATRERQNATLPRESANDQTPTPAAADDLAGLSIAQLRSRARDRGVNPRLPRQQLMEAMRENAASNGGSSGATETTSGAEQLTPRKRQDASVSPEPAAGQAATTSPPPDVIERYHAGEQQPLVDWLDAHDPRWNQLHNRLRTADGDAVSNRIQVAIDEHLGHVLQGAGETAGAAPAGRPAADLARDSDTATGAGNGKARAVSIEPAGDGGRYVLVKGPGAPNHPNSVFGKDGLGGRWYPQRGGYLFPKSRIAEVRGAVDDLNRQISTTTTPTAAKGSNGNGKPAEKRENGPRPPKGFTRADLEARLLEHHRAINGGDVDAGRSAELQQDAGTDLLGPSKFTFHRQLPGEVKSFLQGRPEARSLFRVTDQPIEARGADVMHAMENARPGSYFDMAETAARGRAGELADAKQTARASDDPSIQFYAKVHDALSVPASERKAFEAKTPEQLPPGTRFEFQGEPFRVVEDENGVNVLKDDGTYPELPIEFLDKVPVDKGTLEKPQPQFYDPDAEKPAAAPAAPAAIADGINTAGGKTGLFGQPDFDARPGETEMFGFGQIDKAVKREQARTYSDTIQRRDVTRPSGDTEADAAIRARNENDATQLTLGGDAASATAAEPPPRSRYELERMPLEELRQMAQELGADPNAQEDATERRRLANAILDAQAKAPRPRSIEGGAPAREARAFAADNLDAAAKEPGNIIGSAVEKVKAAAHHLKDSALRYSGKMFPTLTRFSRASGEAAARYVASRAYAKEAAPVIAADVIGPPVKPKALAAARAAQEKLNRETTGRAEVTPLPDILSRTFGKQIDPELDKLVGAVLVEDNLNGIRAGHEARGRQAKVEADGHAAAAAKARAEYQALKAAGIKGVTQGKAAVAKLDQAKAAEAKAKAALRESAEARNEAAKVGSIINAEGSPLSTITEPGKVSMSAALKDPRVRAAVERYKAWFASEPEANYKTAQEIAPETDLPTRGEKTGARVNLIAVDPETVTSGTVYAGGRNPANALKKDSPFARPARGNAVGYEIRASKMIETTLARGTEIANQRRMYDQLVKDGIAVYGKPGDQPTIGGRATGGIDVQRRTLVVNGKAVPQNEKLFVRSDAYPEVRRAVNIDAKPFLPTLAFGSSLANKAALISFGEASAHVANQLSAVVRSPKVSFAGLFKRAFDVLTNDPATRSQLKDLARIGALQEEGHLSTGGVARINPLRYTSKLIKFTDRVARLVMDDAFAKMAKKGKGPAEDTETNRRDFVNQLGQYNIRAQHALVDLARTLGVGPFATAGSNFYSIGLKNLTGSPGVKATSFSAALQLRGMVLARFAAAIGGVALVNYLKWGRVDGGNSIPFGAVRLDDDKDGKSRFFDVAGLLNITRGMRAVGGRAAYQGLQRGDRPAEIVDAAYKEARNTAASPFLGPAIHTAAVALTGYDAGGFDVAGRAAKGESQAARNLTAAAQHFNPIVNKLTGGKGGDQLGRFAVKIGRPDESIATIQARETVAREPVTRSPEEQARHDARRELVKQVRANPDAAGPILTKAVTDKVIPSSEVKQVRRDAGRSDLENMVSHMQPADAVRIYRLGTAKEREQLAGAVRDKILRAAELDPDQQDHLLAQAGIQPPPDLAVNRELHGLNQRAHAAAEAKRSAESLARQLDQAKAAGDTARAESLRQQAIDQLKGSRFSDADTARRQRLQTIHKSIEAVRKRVEEGTLDREKGDDLIRRLSDVATAKRAA